MSSLRVVASSSTPSSTSLVRYDNPILVSTTKDGRNQNNQNNNKKRQEEKTNLTPTEDILNSILPPR